MAGGRREGEGWILSIFGTVKAGLRRGAGWWLRAQSGAGSGRLSGEIGTVEIETLAEP
ncbi:hypothetical protein FIU86_07410 [Roseovarius sp. THAF9]|nr:hypothetical protein FIU86_07410 [Roseovarius sp. THAF9]